MIFGDFCFSGGVLQRQSSSAVLIFLIIMAYSPFALCIVIVVVCLILAILVAAAYERAGYGYVLRNSSWKACHPRIHYGWLLCVRVVGFLYCLSILIYDFVLWGPFIFEYYTQWSFTLLIVYFGVGVGCSLKEIRCNRYAQKSERLLGTQSQMDEENGITVGEQDRSSAPYLSPSEQADSGGYILQLLYQVALGATFVTDVVYWTCIFPSYSYVDVIEISMHAVNLVLLLADVALNSMAFHWFRGAYFFVYTAVFIFFSWIIHALGEKQWPYPFLDVSVDLAPVWYLCLCLVHFVAYGLVCMVMWSKDVILRRVQPSETSE